MIVTDVMSILSANYKSIGAAAAAPSKTKYVPVDPTLYQGIWSGTYANKQSFTISVSNVSGFRAQVKYQSGSSVKFQNVLIKDLSFRVGDTKFTLTKVGTATVKNAVTDPATGSTFLDTATATLK
jgi:hypothetical protein